MYIPNIVMIPPIVWNMYHRNPTLEEICFTDHVDYGVKWDWDSGQEIKYRNGEPLANVDYPRYMEEIEKMQALYGSKIRIRLNLESRHIPSLCFVIIAIPLTLLSSIHQVNDQDISRISKEGKRRRNTTKNIMRKYCR